MMHKSSLSILLLLPFTLSIGQSYNTAGGLRLGSEWGLTAKQRIAKRVTLEGIVQQGIFSGEGSGTLLAERHFPIASKRFNIYTGGGLHAGWQNTEDKIYEDPYGITLIGGAEITLARINISWDFKPAINIYGGDRKLYAHTGISVRYVFWKRDGMKKWFEEGKWKFWKKDRKSGGRR